jgi:rhamnosyltransferase
MVHVFIVGSKGIPAQYGGFETFVENLTAGKKSESIKYHVSCMNNDEKHFEYNGADCFNVKVPLKGAPGRIMHVGLVLGQIEKWLRNNPGTQSIIYILGCRIGPLLIPHSKRLHQLGAKIYCNPDGLEWKRSKWSTPEKKFLHYCERCLVENSDYVVCDSKSIEEYIKKAYKNKIKKTTYIAYGAYPSKSTLSKDELNNWLEKFHISNEEYYLIVGRFVPENNYETMISEFMKSKTKRDLVIITNVEQNKFFDELKEKTGFQNDKRIKFVGTVYNQNLLKKIRENAYGYLHGHEVGGTNPSLLEALSSTNLNLLLDVGFNREVGENTALYWSKAPGNLSTLIDRVDNMPTEKIEELGRRSTNRIEKSFNWPFICEQYEKLFLS